jgi:hypothetical protein
VGRGLGGYALTLAVRRAWQAEPEGYGPVRRVWLHTSTLDHPNAIGNYCRRGFRLLRTEPRGQAVHAAGDSSKLPRPRTE